ncbi:SprT family zinc-dependent metalloprotease [Sporosarcina sp. ITBMC105]
MTLDQITEYAREFLRNSYGMEMVEPIKRNNRLTRSMARYVYYGEEESHIEIAGFMLKYAADCVIKAVIRHECVHYAMHRLCRPFDDGQAEFEAELKKRDAPSTGLLKVGEFYDCECSKCGSKWDSDCPRLLRNPTKYVSVCCRAKIEVGEVRILDGTEALK